jgi:catechol 2,3-dioxygenase-like lactoylglutathione lyase family enzyme
MATIEHIGYAANDTAALANWYVEMLDFKIIFESAGDPKIYFVQDANGMVIEILPPGKDGVVTEGFSNHLALWSEDYDAEKKELESKGVVFEPEVSNEFFGGTKFAFFTDPEGHRIQIITRAIRLEGQA